MESSQVEALIGKWLGPSRLFLNEEIFESEFIANIRLVGQGQFIAISYAWQFEGESQEGLILVPVEIGEESEKAVWLDSWHMRKDIMLCEETSSQVGIFSLQGSYSAPPGPDWGWRIELTAPMDGLFDLRMYNITPKGQEILAVNTQYRKDDEEGLN